MVEPSIHEVDFCGLIATAAEHMFRELGEADPAFPFAAVRVEGLGTGAAKRKRKDLCFFAPGGRLALCGEVKLPGTPEARSPYDERVVRDAFLKADNAVVDFFFTWNVNTFVLWDRRQYDRPLLERRVREWKLGLTLASPEDVARSGRLGFALSPSCPVRTR
jgi:hypothetical protein